MRIFLTGMSGTGKTTILRHLAKNRFAVADLDETGWMETDENGERLIRIGRVRSFLSAHSDMPVALAGCAVNQHELYPLMDVVLLLCAPLDVMRRRILTRTDNPFGKTDSEWEAIVSDTAEVVPLLKRSCSAVINTDRPLEEVVREIQKVLRLPDSLSAAGGE